MYRHVLGGIVVLALLTPTQGQDASTRFLVGAPGEIRNKPIDVSRAIRTTNRATRSFNLGATQHSSLRNFSFSNIFNKTSLGTWPNPAPNVTVLPKSQNVFQPNPPKGINLFDPPKKANASSALKIFK